MAVVDIHSHFFPQAWPDLAKRFGTPDWPWIRHLGDGKAMIMVGEREFRPIYAACWDADTRLAEMDRDGVEVQILCATPVLVHPWDMLGGARTARHMMGWTVAMLAETQLSIVSMILGGAFDRLPRSLKICFAHGGGSFAFLLGRLVNAWHNRDVARGVSQLPPSHYLDRFSVDSAVFDERALRLLVDVMGRERVMLGSDYPFPLGERCVGRLVRESRSLSDAERSAILGDNATGFFGLP